MLCVTFGQISLWRNRAFEETCAGRSVGRGARSLSRWGNWAGRHPAFTASSPSEVRAVRQGVSGRGWRGLLEAATGFEPVNNGFANHRLRPLGYAASRDGVQIIAQTGESFKSCKDLGRGGGAVSNVQFSLLNVDLVACSERASRSGLGRCAFRLRIGH